MAAAACIHLPLLRPFLLLKTSRHPPPPPPLQLRFNSTAGDAVATATAAVASDDLRAQLDDLRLEAEATRGRANSFRKRLMRLSEAAESFQQQAAAKVQVGLEIEAMDMLLQKRKVMQALENCKRRIERLEELSAKLSEAISLKETQLVESITADVEADRNDTSPVRIVAPKDETLNYTDKVEECAGDAEAVFSVEEKHDSQEAMLEQDDTENDKIAVVGTSCDHVTLLDSMEGVSSFQEFVEHLDKQLFNIEKEIVNVLRYSDLVMDKDQKLNNFKLQETFKLLVDMKGIRKRIASIKEAQL